MITVLLVCLGGAIGAPARYLTDRVIQSRRDGVFPWGTLIVNVIGSLILGALVGLGVRHHLPAAVVALIGTGFCGALTTFSTMQVELLEMLDAHRYGLAVSYAGASVAAGFAAVHLATAAVRRIRVLT